MHFFDDKNMNEKLTLVVMAAGMGSRYGGSKQMKRFGFERKTLSDFSMDFASAAGFGRTILIVGENVDEKWKNDVEKMHSGKMRIEWKKQEIFPGMKKPCGTAHAVLQIKDLVDSPFVVVNADDFYGKDPFVSMTNFFSNRENDSYAMVGFELGKTLSENGSVSRGICEIDEEENLSMIKETMGIKRFKKEIKDSIGNVFDECVPVSMNFWGFDPSVFDVMDSMFDEYVSKGDFSNEFTIPDVVERIINIGFKKIKVLKTNSEWFGLTYKNDDDVVEKKTRTIYE